MILEKKAKFSFPVMRVKGKNQEAGRSRGETGSERCPLAARLRTGVSGASQGTPASPHQPPCLRCCSSCPSRPLALPTAPIQPVPLMGILQCSSMVPSSGVHALGLTLTCRTTSSATQENIHNYMYTALTPARPPLDTPGCPLTTLVKNKLFTGHLLESARETLFKTLANVGRN